MPAQPLRLVVHGAAGRMGQRVIACAQIEIHASCTRDRAAAIGGVHDARRRKVGWQARLFWLRDQEQQAPDRNHACIDRSRVAGHQREPEG